MKYMFTFCLLVSTSLVVAQPKFRPTWTNNPNDTIGVTVQLQPGWNIVSSPVLAESDSVPLLFPICLGCPLWPPPPHYRDPCRLPPGAATWLKCPTGGVITIFGERIVRDTIRVLAGWNLIGSISAPIDTSSVVSIPADNRVSNFFGWRGYYEVSDTIQPGQGYWVKARSAGWLVLSQ